MTTEKHKKFRRLAALYISMKDVETNEQAAVIEKSMRSQRQNYELIQRIDRN